MNLFKGRHFERHIILWAVRWYCKYGISYRELQEMLAEQGVNVNHTTIYRWVQRSAPEMKKRRRWYWRQPSGFGSWHLDETYVKVNGRWAYLYRTVDSRGCTIDFYLSSRRHTKAAYRFMGKLLNNTKRLQIPRLINTDKAPTYGRALALLKREGKCPQHVHHRQIQYRNNIIECDHGKLKRIINATLECLLSLLSPFDIVVWMTDGRPLYESHLKGKLHVISKRYMQRIERHNLNLRQHLARLGRKSLSFMVRNLNRFFSDHLTMEGDTTHTCYGADQHEFYDKNAIFAVFLT